MSKKISLIPSDQLSGFLIVNLYPILHTVLCKGAVYPSVKTSCSCESFCHQSFIHSSVLLAAFPGQASWNTGCWPETHAVEDSNSSQDTMHTHSHQGPILRSHSTYKLVFGWWEETGESRRNPHGYSKEKKRELVERANRKQPELTEGVTWSLYK